MTIRIGNAPCSWGVEFADDPRNPAWRQVLSDCAAAGYKGIELGPIGFMPEDPAILGEALAEKGALEKARLSLAKVKSLCGESCPETRKLAAAIAAGPHKAVKTAEANVPETKSPQSN